MLTPDLLVGAHFIARPDAADELQLKRAALLFDHIAVGWVFQTPAIAFLAEHGILLMAHEVAGQQGHDARWDAGEFHEGFHPAEGENLRMDMANRVFAAGLSERSGVQAVPLLQDAHSIRAALTGNSVCVTQIVLRQMPLPSEDTPWEAVADWRSDAEARVRYRRLRAWMQEMTRANMTAVDLITKTATLLDDYSLYVSRHHKRIARTGTRVVVNAVAGAFVNGIRGDLPRALASLLDIFTEHVTLLENELDAPGREIAYIAQAHDRFRP